MPQTQWLIKIGVYFSQFWRLGGQDPAPGASTQVSEEALLPGCRWWLRPAPSHSGRDELVSRVLLIRALISFMQPSPLWPNYLPRTPYLIPSHLKLGFQHMNFGETQTFRPHHGMRLTKSKIEWLNLVNHSPERGLCRYPDISFQTCSPNVPSTERWRKRRSVSSRSTVSKQKVDNVRTWWRMGKKMLDNMYPLWVQVTP